MENPNSTFDEDLRTFLLSRSQLCGSYGIKDKKDKIRSVIDVDTVIDIFKELILINNPEEKFD